MGFINIKQFLYYCRSNEYMSVCNLDDEQKKHFELAKSNSPYKVLRIFFFFTTNIELYNCCGFVNLFRIIVVLFLPK